MNLIDFLLRRDFPPLLPAHGKDAPDPNALCRDWIAWDVRAAITAALRSQEVNESRPTATRRTKGFDTYFDQPPFGLGTGGRPTGPREPGWNPCEILARPVARWRSEDQVSHREAQRRESPPPNFPTIAAARIDSHRARMNARFLASLQDADLWSGATLRVTLAH